MESGFGLCKQNQARVLKLQGMIVVKLFRIDQRNIAGAIFGEHLLGTSANHVFGKFGETGSRLADGNDVTRSLGGRAI